MFVSLLDPSATFHSLHFTENVTSTKHTVFTFWAFLLYYCFWYCTWLNTLLQATVVRGCFCVLKRMHLFYSLHSFLRTSHPKKQ